MQSLLLILMGLFLYSNCEDIEGYLLEEIHEDLMAKEATGPRVLSCPSSNVIRMRYRCKDHNDDTWKDCYRNDCCPGYNYVVNQCIVNGTDPCSLNLCDQKCSVFFGRVICTCYSGYKFNIERHKLGEDACVDINECENRELNDCEQNCDNTLGSYGCGCNDGFILQEDNSTCLSETSSEVTQEQPAHRPDYLTYSGSSCVAGCALVKRLKSKIESMEEKIRSLSTAMKLYSFAGGKPGPPGPPGPPGALGPRGFPGPTGGGVVVSRNDDDDNEDDPLESLDQNFDSYTIFKKSGKRNFCRCKRGPVGPPGSPGKDGLRGLRGERGKTGKKGEPGSFDFIMLMMADIRTDIQEMQRKLWPGKLQTSSNYDFKQHIAWEKEIKAKQQRNRNNNKIQLEN